MSCSAHPGKSAQQICAQCNTALCDECLVGYQGEAYCRSCIPAPSPIYKRRINWGLLFLFSCFFPSGTNYMYMGLIKRGLAAMCGFFLLIFLTAVTGGMLAAVLGMSIGIYYLTCIFDGFNIRRRILSGEVVADSVHDVLGTVLSNKKLVAVIIAVIAVLVVIQLLGFIAGIISNFLPIIVIGVGLYLIFRKK